MKLRHGSFLFSLVAASALMAGGACSSGGGNPTGAGGNTGTGGQPGLPPPENLISNFEDTVATVVHAGTPERNGYWYSYNDGVSGCVQDPQAAQKLQTPPIIAEVFESSSPATFPGNGSGSTKAIHSTWDGCTTWGAGVGADLNQPAVADGGTYDGPKVVYDASGYKGLTFWAMAASGSETHLRVKVNMSDETKEVDGGLCKEDGVAHAVGKCSDAWGQVFTLPGNGSWAKINVDFSDHTKFKQEGWGDVFPWDPTHVVSIQIQSTMTGEAYDLWVDDVYFTN